jgi:hypothetical protein
LNFVITPCFTDSGYILLPRIYTGYTASTIFPVLSQAFPVLPARQVLQALPVLQVLPAPVQLFHEFQGLPLLQVLQALQALPLLPVLQLLLFVIDRSQST